MPALYNSGVLNSGGAMNNVAAGVITSALELGLQQGHLEHLREEYHRRLSAIFEVCDYATFALADQLNYTVETA